MIRRLRARLRRRRQRRILAQIGQALSDGHVTAADLDQLARGGVPAYSILGHHDPRPALAHRLTHHQETS